MNEVDHEHEVLVWCDGQRAELVRRVLGRLAELTPVAVGGPARGPVAPLADSLSVKLHDDLRRMLIDFPARYLLLATLEDVGPEELRLAAEAGLHIITLDPPDGWEGDDTAPLSIAPSMRQSPAWLSAAEPLGALGNLRSVQIATQCPRWAGTLHARLYEAMEMLIALLGVPLTADASLAGGPPEVPDNLASLTGDLTAHLRFNSGRSAVLFASDHAPHWSRRLSILGDTGQLTLDDISYTLTDSSGKVVDALVGSSHAASPTDPAELIARQWRRALDHQADPPAVDPASITSCCRAALLSCKTAQLESPDTLLRMRGV